MTLNEKIGAAIDHQNSLVCIGLDTDPAKIPEPVRNSPDAVCEFNRIIIDATRDLAAAYKPNLAFYEALGRRGWEVLERTIRLIPDNVIKIGDAKRGDIGNTAAKYAGALFDLGFDAVTVNPYMGWDSIAPFVEAAGKGAFILCMTSNPSAAELQNLESGGRPLYQHVAEKITAWNKHDNCGLVAGATRPEILQDIRAIAPDLPFLIPGIGAQGGDLEKTVAYGTDAQGGMALINSSRGILYASAGKDFAGAARGKALELRDAINRYRALKKKE